MTDGQNKQNTIQYNTMSKTKQARKRVRKSNASKVAELKIERLPLAELKPHPRNDEIRNHPEEGSPRWRVMVKSLERDYFDPIVWNESNGFLVSGHFRLKVMLSEGYTHADVSIVDYDEPTHLARMLAANNGLGEENIEGISSFVGELDDLDLDLSLTGFDNIDLKRLTPKKGKEQEEQTDHTNGTGELDIELDDEEELTKEVKMEFPFDVYSQLMDAFIESGEESIEIFIANKCLK